jgi:copper chaperone for superoxide dismutase
MRCYEFLVKSTDEILSQESLKELFLDKAKIKSYNPNSGHVIFETSQSADDIAHMLQLKFPSVKLIGQSSQSHTQAAGVAIIGGNSARGIVRLLDDGSGLHVEGTVSGLKEGSYYVSINEYGDISNACLSTGNPVSYSCDKTPCGILGNIESDGLNDTKFSLYTGRLSILECIGRSLVVQNNAIKIACGIVGRSSGVLENDKKICACDGSIIWEEQVFGPYAVAPPIER